MTYTITINPTTDGQLPKYTSRHPDGYRAVIDSVTGTVANGETLTINGHFSAKRDGDLFSFISRSTDSGEAIFNGYFHTTEDSFIGSGSSIARDMANPGGTPGDPHINIGLLDELYCSHLYKMDISGYGIASQGPQIKMTRFMVPEETHTSELNCTNNIYGEGGTYSGTGNTTAGMFGAPSDPNLPEIFFNEWVRTWTYFKRNDDGFRNGGTFYCHKVESTKNCIFNWHDNNIHANDARLNNNEILSPFFTPKYFFEATAGRNPSGPYLTLPFYIKGGLIIKCYIDGLILNDSPESVWLVDSEDVDASMATGKAVHLPQISRNTEAIQAECWLGDFTASDNIYVTTFNQDGKYATPLLVRSAV